ncbi:hypothetical protein DFJ73DRAFT_964337 [Zopfochytrium polystomum]|nr:hypothetical protein DFJ73DRAFT_964337 [Zopfochytrium polystomum]
MGPAVVRQFGTISPAPPELQQKAFSKLTNMAGSLHFEPAMRVTHDGVYIENTVVVHVSQFKIKGNYSYADDPASTLSGLVQSMAQMTDVDPTLLSWARTEALAHASRLKTHGLWDRLIARSSRLPRRTGRCCGVSETTAESAGKQIVLVFAGVSMCSNGIDWRTDDYAVCVLLEPYVPGKPMVLKRLGVFHTFDYTDEIKKRRAVSTFSGSPGSPLFEDFCRRDVLIKTDTVPRNDAQPRTKIKQLANLAHMLLLNTRTNKVEHFSDAASAPPYAAVSYLWPQSTAAIAPWTSAALVTASGQPAPFQSKWPIPSCTPETLNTALTAIYLGGASVLDADASRDPAAASPPPQFSHLWMDVLCIPQDDDVAKGAEVSKMGSYYSNAVCAWVFLDDLGQPSIPLRKGQKPARWFTRLWTLQECVLPRKHFFYVESVAPSKSKNPLTSLFNSKSNAQSPQPFNPLWISRKHAIAHVWVASQLELILGEMTPAYALAAGLQLLALGVENPSARTALLLSSMRDCRFPSDRLYGVLGLFPLNDVSVFDHSKIKVDYKKPFEEVAADFALAMGPAVVRQFGTISPAPPELQQEAFSKHTNMGWFGSFKPGFFINGTVGKEPDTETVRRILTDNFYKFTASAMDEMFSETAGARYKDVDFGIKVTPDGVQIDNTVVVHVSEFKAVRDNYNGVDAQSAFTDLVNLMTHMTKIEPPLLSWARAELLAHASRFKTHGLVDRVVGGLTASANIFVFKESRPDLSFAYPKFVKNVEIVTANGTLMKGIGDDGRVMAESPGKQIVLVFSGVSMCSDGSCDQQTDDYAVCIQLEPYVPGKPLVLKKLGVFHTFSYGDKKAVQKDGTPLFDDFCRKDVLIK